MSTAAAWVLILGMAATNLAERLLPMTLLSRAHLPRWAERWLSFVPVSVMAAIVATQVITPQGRLVVPWDNPYLFAALPTAGVYAWSRNYLLATVVGVASFLAFRYLLG